MAGQQDQYIGTGQVPENPLSGGVVNPLLIKSDFQVPGPSFSSPGPSPQQAGHSQLSPDIREMINKGQQMGDMLKTSITEASDYGRNQQYYSTPRSVNQDDFERYYQHPSYDKLGYSPWRDNEQIYNDNSSGWADFRRSASMWPSLAWTGFKSGFSSWGDLMEGKPFKEDVESAREFQKIMQIGSSSRGGVSGFMTNTFLNSGYTFGVMGEMIAEEVGLGALTFFSGGTAAPETIPAMGARATMAFNRIFKGFEMMKGISKAIAGMRDVNSAKHFWNAVRKTGEFINPLSHTTQFLMKSDNMKNLAKTSNLFGSFYRDLREINFALSESKLEGGSAYLDESQRLTDEFYSKHGRMPDAKEQQHIIDTAKAAGYATTILNLPTIYFTNKITFDGLFKGFRPLSQTTEEFLTKAGSKIAFDRRAALKGLNPFTYVEPGLRSVGKAFINPRTYAKAGLNYFRGNLSEGLQESLQDVISGSVKDYYAGVYNNPGHQGMDDVRGAISHNLVAQFSQQGLETFLGGFVMGSLVQPVTALPGWTTTGYHKLFKPEEYAKYKEAKEKYTRDTVDRLNELYKDPLKYFGSGVVNIGAQAQMSAGMDQAQANGDGKGFYDLKDASAYEHIWTSLDTDTFDSFIDRLNSIRDMDVQTVNEAFGTENGQEILGKIDGIISRARSIKSNYDMWQERAPNPFNPRKYKQGTPEYVDEAISSRAWDLARKNAVFMNYSFGRTVERMKGIFEDLSKFKPLEKADPADITVLLEPETIRSEMALLKSEISALSTATDSESKRTLREKRNKMEKLDRYLEKLRDYQDVLFREYAADEVLKQGEKPEGIDKFREKILTEKGKKLAKVKQAYRAYIKNLARAKRDYMIADVADATFERISDFYELSGDAENLSEVVNMLSDPEGFAEHFRRNTGTLRSLYNNRKEQIEEGIKKTIEKKETNSLLNQLYEKGIIMDSEDLEAYLTTGKIPEVFYDKVNKVAIRAGDPRYNEAVAILSQHQQAVGTTVELVSDEEFADFVDNDKVTEERLLSITEKVSKGEVLTERENAIFVGRTVNVNDLIAAKAKSGEKAPSMSISAATPWLELPQSVRTELEPLWEEYKSEHLQDAEEYELERFRQTWLTSPKAIEVISRYNLQQKLRNVPRALPSKAPELRTLGKFEKTLDQMSLAELNTIVRELRAINSRADDNDPKKSLRSLDIQDLEDFIAKRRTAAPQNKSERVRQILEQIERRQQSVQGRSEDALFYIIDGDLYNRVTTVILPEVARLTGQKPDFIYPKLDQVLEVWNKNNGDLETFMQAFRNKNLAEFNDRKYADIEAALSVSFDVNTLTDKVNELAYDESRKVGNTLDALIRSFLQEQPTEKPEGMAQEAYDNLLERLTEIRDNILDKNLTVLANNIVLYDPEQKVAGEVDILAIDKDGEVYIYDIKSSRKANWDVYDDTKNLKSNKIKHQLQVSAYGNLLYNSYGISPKGYGIVPLEVEYDRDGNIEALKTRKTIKLEYSSEVEAAVPRNTDQPPLLEVTPAPTPKPVTPGTGLSGTEVKEMIDFAETPEELAEVKTRLLEYFAKGEVEIPADQVESMVQKRASELARTIDVASLSKGEVLYINTPEGQELHKIVEITADSITFEKLNSSDQPLKLTKSQVAEKFTGKWSKDMEVTRAEEPTQEEKKLITMSGDLATQFLSDKAKLQEIADDAEKKLDSSGSMNTLLDNLDC